MNGKGKMGETQARAISVLRHNGFKVLEVCWLLRTCPQTVSKYAKKEA
jgi:hypothetical protein